MGPFKELRARVDVESVIADLRAIDHTSVWERTRAIGRVVFEGVFAGDIREWRAKRGNKSKSLRKLVGHPQCPFKKSALSVAVNVYLFAQERPEVGELANITPSHVNTVCSLPPAEAFELLSAASAASWTIRDLAERVRLVRRESGERRGRPCSGSSQRAETMGRRGLRALERMQALLFEEEELDEAARERLSAILETVAETCTRMQSLLERGPSLRSLACARPGGRAALESGVTSAA